MKTAEGQNNEGANAKYPMNPKTGSISPEPSVTTDLPFGSIGRTTGPLPFQTLGGTAHKSKYALGHGIPD